MEGKGRNRLVFVQLIQQKSIQVSLLGCFFIAHFVFPSENRISFLIPHAFRFAVIKYLINNHYAKNQYNQDANYAYLDRPVNESIGKKSPKEYFSLALEQCQTKVAVCGSITDEDLLQKNLAMNCIPSDVFKMDQNDYTHFLEVRRLLMANKIRKYYESL